MTPPSALFRYRAALIFFITGLVLSGITAFPLLTEVRLAVQLLGLENVAPQEAQFPPLHWLLKARAGLEYLHAEHGWLAYGTDWLAFGHLVIALFFIPPLFRPEHARDTLRIGLVACALVIPLALIAGGIRGLPLWWRLIDCSFGVIGALPLLYALKLLPQITAEK